MKLTCGIIFYVSIPAFDMLVILIFYNNLDFYFRSTFIFLLIQFGFALFYHNYIVCSVSTAAHSIYPKLNSLIVKRRLDYRTKSRVIALIEKLSGPKIAFNCMDWFPLTNFEFFLFVINCIQAFILITGLIK
jgi:hypothetical protein